MKLFVGVVMVGLLGTLLDAWGLVVGDTVFSLALALTVGLDLRRKG